MGDAAGASASDRPAMFVRACTERVTPRLRCTAPSASAPADPLAGDPGLPFADGGGGVTGWETSERVLESGGFESRQRVLVAEPVVEASEAGARTLGVTYWQAVDRFMRGGVRASWTGGGGTLKLLGGATLLTFGSAELSFD